LPGLDGRKLFIRSAHSALNTLLQGAGAIVMKQALVLLDTKIRKLSLNAQFVANVHDEWQIECSEEDADLVGSLAVDSIKTAGVKLGLRCPLDGEYKKGKTWAMTH
jgi:DNA polymerase-1